MIKRYAIVLLSLVLANPAVADALSFKCSLLSSPAPVAPSILILASDQDGKKMNWQADNHNEMLDVSLTADSISFRGPYGAANSSLNRSTGSLVVLGSKYRRLEFLCQHTSDSECFNWDVRLTLLVGKCSLALCRAVLPASPPAHLSYALQ
jgi:hypothetical protein